MLILLPWMNSYTTTSTTTADMPFRFDHSVTPFHTRTLIVRRIDLAFQEYTKADKGKSVKVDLFPPFPLYLHDKCVSFFVSFFRGILVTDLIAQSQCIAIL